MSTNLTGNIRDHLTTLIGGTIIPLYTYPTDPTWTTIINVKGVHPKVPMVAIANPNSGPGSFQDINFVNGINKLRVHGISVIGYIATDYVPPTYVGTVDTILIYEGQGLPELSYLRGWHSYYGRNNWGITSYGHLHLNQRYIFNAKQNVGYLYITNNVLPNPYDALPPYFSTMVAELDQNSRW